MSTAIDLRSARPWASSAVIATVAYLVTALMMFAGYVSAYLILRAGAGAWPPPGQPRLPVGVSTVNALVLLGSGALVVRARRAARRETAARRLRWAAVLGAFFVAVQGLEWARLLRFGLATEAGVFGGTFYAFVGTHALHVLGGLAVLWISARRVALGRGDLTACALYWGFVVLVWPVLYVLLYVV